jgi:SAM-dependent methyltransferase
VSGETPDHVLRNRQRWDRLAAEYVEPGRLNWQREEPEWGVFSVPESQLHVLPEDASGLESVELGCGTAYVSAWLARRGAQPVGVDNSRAQLETARRFQHEFGLHFPLVHASAEQVPLVGGRFDLAISEYGASIWCDPFLWVAEAARLLRAGGRLVFLVDSALSICCSPDDENAPVQDRLLRPYFGMHSIEWPGENSVEFHLTHGDMVRLLSDCGFVLEELTEIQPPEGSSTRYEYVTLEWSRNWPGEEVWKARKLGSS